MVDINDVWEEYITEYVKNKKNPCGIKTVGDEKITPEEFVYRILVEGTNVCDSTSQSFNEKFCLPPFYDEELFKRGQQFTKKYIFSFAMHMLFGFLTMGLQPVINVEYASERSNSPIKMYKRLVKSLVFIKQWMYLDFDKNSNMWESLKKTRNAHSSVSKSSFNAINYGIMQRDMSFTVFMFIGYTLTRNKMLGIENPKREELEGVIHLWRVLGHFMGVDDKFNICRGNVEETTAIMNILIDHAFKPFFNKADKLRDDLFEATNSLCAFNPIITSSAAKHYIFMLLNNTKGINMKDSLACEPLNFPTKIRLYIYNFLFWLSKFDLGRIAINNIYIFNLWLISKYPGVNSSKLMREENAYKLSKMN